MSCIVAGRAGRDCKGDHDEGHGLNGKGALASLSEQAVGAMDLCWRTLDEGRRSVPTLEKHQLLLDCVGRPRLDQGSDPFQSAALLVRLRNALAHYRSETVAPDVEHRFDKQLNGRFEDSVLMKGSGNPWWPDHALGAGCAHWAYEVSRGVADAVVESTQLQPNYKALESEWFTD